MKRNRLIRLGLILLMANTIDLTTQSLRAVMAKDVSAKPRLLGRVPKGCKIAYAYEKNGAFPALVFCSFERDNPIFNKKAVLVYLKGRWTTNLSGRGDWEYVGRSADSESVWAIGRMVSYEGPGQRKIWHSPDGGRTWRGTRLAIPPSLQFEELFFESMKTGDFVFSVPEGDEVGLAPGFRVYRTRNDGLTWKKLPVTAKRPIRSANSWIIDGNKNNRFETPSDAAAFDQFFDRLSHGKRPSDSREKLR